MILGVTGGTGCGKTTLLKCVQALGGLVLDCDEIYHELLDKDTQMLAAIQARFPDTVTDGKLNRKALGKLVFSDAAALADLNAITHRAVRREVVRILKQSRPQLAAIDAIALFEGGLAGLCDVTVAVTAPEELRLQRLMERDGISCDYARLRIAAQKTNEEFQSMCTQTLENRGTKEEFEANCLAFLRRLGRMHMTEKEKWKMTTDELRDSLLYEPKNGYTRLSDAQRGEMEDYCRRYANFMDACKTEREASAWTADAAKEHGFRPLTAGMSLKAGDKVYYVNRNKSILLAVIGTQSLACGANICAAHVDSPRMDLKPNPLYEDSEIAYFKTHYYGGIKKYQWTTVPLALHGVVYRKDGSVVTVTVGEDEHDPVLCVSDLLIHLSGDQMKKPAAEAVAGEQLNVILGTEPLEGEGADLVKLHIMKLINEKYGIVEADFRSAELTIVPAGKCREVGLDRSLLGAYGHDDRVCAYAEIEPLLNLETPKHTAVCILADKEEIGSVGISGMQSQAFEYFMGMLCDAQGVSLRECFANSFCLSADVSNAYDPNFAETCDKRNNSQLNYGVSICKYTGSRGKGGASDASAEAMGHVRTTLDNAGVIWQIATLGKVDQGGGGTVAAYMANRNIVTVDAGVPVLSMHAPWELVSKLDCYMTMLACKAIYLA